MQKILILWIQRAQGEQYKRVNRAQVNPALNLLVFWVHYAKWSNCELIGGISIKNYYNNNCVRWLFNNVLDNDEDEDVEVVQQQEDGHDDDEDEDDV